MRHAREEKELLRYAPDSRFIRIIGRLYTLTDVREAERFQARLDTLSMRYCLLSPEGRLEFMSALISGNKQHFDEQEKRALAALLADLEAKEPHPSAFLDFSREYLKQSLQACELGALHAGVLQGGSCAKRLLKASPPAAAILLAVSLSGSLAPGCSRSEAPAGTARAAHHGASAQTVPGSRSAGPAAAAGTETASEGTAGQVAYCVREGDSVRNIARARGLDYRRIVEMNGIPYDQARDWFILHPGQVLLLPGPDAAEPGTGRAASGESGKPGPADFYDLPKTDGFRDGTVHLVVKGDSLWKISRLYNVPIPRIVEANRLARPDRVICGSMLRIPGAAPAAEGPAPAFSRMDRDQKVAYLRSRTIRAGHAYLPAIVDLAEEYRVDPRLYAALIWEESWFDEDARSKDNCRKLVQLDPRFHAVSEDVVKNFRKSLGYLRHEFVYYRTKGFDKRTATLCALAAYNGGNTRIRRYVSTGKWDGKRIETIPLRETREHLRKVARRCEHNYQARL